MQAYDTNNTIRTKETLTILQILQRINHTSNLIFSGDFLKKKTPQILSK